MPQKMGKFPIVQRNANIHSDDLFQGRETAPYDEEQRKESGRQDTPQSAPPE